MINTVCHHAICFVGENAEEKAEYNARAILCGGGEPPCEVCNSCKKAQNKIHPDIIRVREGMTDGKYKVKELREVAAQAGYRPNDGEFKVYIFTQADTMRPECQNALLKFTEEPPEFVRIIFTVKSADLLLETIKSRLVFINAKSAETVHSPELSEIAKDFMKALGTNSEYMAASALSRIKTRDELSAVLDIIAGEIRKTMYNSQHTIHNWAEAQKFLQNCIDDLKYNPNVTLACTNAAVGIMEVKWRK